MQDNNILVLNFADAKIPEFKEVRGKEHVLYGEDDNFPEYLLTLFGKSAKHGAIVKNKVTYIYGSGLKAKAPSPIADQYLLNANPYQSWNDLSRQSIMDIEVFGGFYWQMVPTFGGKYNAYLLPFNKVRVSKDGTQYFFKNNWKDNKEAARPFPAFYRGIATESIYQFREYQPATDNRYAIPGYMNACNYIESDVEVSKHTLTNAKTGFSASKFINFYNGEPEEGKKRAIQRRFEDAFTGSEGKKLIIAFNNDPNRKTTVDDLGQSDLTKEDFTVVDDLITQNIYAGHQITSPMLFGIQTPEKLGGHSEMQLAYEIFKNTYANSKQRQMEDIVNYFASINGITSEFEFMATDPVGVNISDAMVEKVAPPSWILEKLGIDAEKYPDTPVAAPTPGQQMAGVNDHLKNMTGRQFQQIERIKRKFKAGQITRDEAAMLLKNSFGLEDADINVMLGEAQAFSDDSEEVNDEELSAAFDSHGEELDGYEVIRSKAFKFDSDEEMIELSEMFKEGEKGLLSRITGTMPKILVRYTYEKRKDAAGPSVLDTTRPFCKKMVSLSRMYSREDIQKISDFVGYNVFKRTGGFWNKNGKIVPHCRHEWRTNIVFKKEKK